jgi:hypothetical protein
LELAHFQRALLEQTRRRIINLPWIGAAVSSIAWLGCIPAFITARVTAGQSIHSQLLWHLPISFLVSAFIAVTQTFFLIELASHWGLFLVFSRDARDLGWCLPNRIAASAHVRIAGGAPFAVFVGTVGIAFGLCSAILIPHLVAKPGDEFARGLSRRR